MRLRRVNQISCRMRAIASSICSFTSMSRSSVSRRDRSKMKTVATNQAVATEKSTFDALSHAESGTPIVSASCGGLVKSTSIGALNATTKVAVSRAIGDDRCGADGRVHVSDDRGVHDQRWWGSRVRVHGDLQHQREPGR